MKNSSKTKNQLLEELKILKKQIQKHELKEIKFKQIEEKLFESEKKLQTIFENIGVGITVLNPDMEIITYNRQIQKCFPKTKINSKAICYQVYKDLPTNEICAYCPTVKKFEDGKTHETTVSFTPQNNSIKHYRIKSSPIKNKKGEVTSAIEMVDDITLEKIANDKLHEKQELLNSIFEAMGEGILVFNNSGEITHYNKLLLKMWNITETQIKKQNKEWIFNNAFDQLVAFDNFIKNETMVLGIARNITQRTKVQAKAEA